MKLLGVITDDFVNYKKPSMTVEFPYCSMKCNTEAGREICHNSHLKDCELIDISVSQLLEIYLRDDITQAIVLQGMEPFDSYDALLELVSEFRAVSGDDIIIYTGYNPDEITEQLKELKQFSNIFVKFGRFKPHHTKHFDQILGIYLQSDNQFAVHLDTYKL